MSIRIGQKEIGGGIYLGEYTQDGKPVHLIMAPPTKEQMTFQEAFLKAHQDGYGLPEVWQAKAIAKQYQNGKINLLVIPNGFLPLSKQFAWISCPQNLEYERCLTASVVDPEDLPRFQNMDSPFSAVFVRTQQHEPVPAL